MDVPIDPWHALRAVNPPRFKVSETCSSFALEPFHALELFSVVILAAKKSTYTQTYLYADMASTTSSADIGRRVSDEERQLWKKAFYLPKLPQNITVMRRILEEYSQIPANEVDDHILKIVSIPFPSTIGRA